MVRVDTNHGCGHELWQRIDEKKILKTYCMVKPMVPIMVAHNGS